MDNIKHLIFKSIFPFIVFVIGLIVVLFGAFNEQSVQFIIGGAGLIAVGILLLLLMIKLTSFPSNLYKILIIVMIPGIIIMFWLGFNSIHDPIQFENEYNRRGEVVKERLVNIRNAQEAFRSVNRRYTGDFDTLITFIKEGQLPLVKIINNTPIHLQDSLPESELIRRGYIIIDTNYINVQDSIFRNVMNFNPDNLPYIPFSDPRTKFEMKAGFITRSGIKVPVFEVVADKELYLSGLREEFIAQDKVISLQVGSLTEPIRDGNWE